MTLYLPDELTWLAAKLAQAVGVPEDDAVCFAQALVDADLHGTSTHGLSRLKIYLERIRRGVIDPHAALHLTANTPAVLVADAGNGLGHVQALKVLERLIPLARQYGIAAATIKQSQHFGALSYYCNRAAAHDMILLATTSCEPAMSPTGGYTPFFGTNPIAASFPTGKGFPVKIDLATSIVARGNIIAAQKENRSIPEGWALDPDGHPTTDPGRALLGTVLTMAGHKGYALALMVEVLSGVLSGAAVGPGIGSMYKQLDRPQDVGHFFCLIDITAFMAVDQFKGRLDGMIDQIKQAPRRPGTEEILVPGERSYRKACRFARGLPLGNATVDELQKLCVAYDVAFDLQPAAAAPAS